VIQLVQHRLKQFAKARFGSFVARRQPVRGDLPHSLWGLRIGPTGSLWSGDLDLLDVARTHGTPLHLVQVDALDRNISMVTGSSHDAPGDRPDVFFSYKTNPVVGVLRHLHGRGIGAEVISPFELWLAFSLGVDPSRIIYNGPAKTDHSIRTAIRREILLINANSIPEARRISRIAEEERRRVSLGLRVALPSMWGGQFGIDWRSPTLREEVRRCRSDPWVDLTALHFHRGITIRDRQTMTCCTATILEFCDRLRDETGWSPTMLDVGGSLACPTVATIPALQHRLNRALGSDLIPPDPGDTISLGEAAMIAGSMVGEHFGSVGVPQPRVIMEPGRALTGNTQLLLTSVVDVKVDTALPHAVLDAGINIAEPVPNEFHQLFSASAPGDPATTSYRLVGPICTPADVLYNNWRLPTLEPGHVLAIMDAGAYFVPFATAFSFPRAKILMQRDAGSIESIRRAETFEDLVRCESELIAVDRLDAAP
jgi:diaminopimelate decarboxylase